MTKAFDPNNLGTVEFYKLLTNTIIPRPIAFVSSCDKKGNVNLSPFSFFNVFSSNPPILVFSPVKRRDKSLKDTLNNVLEYPEVVINLVSSNMVQQVSLSSSDYDKEINEFDKTGFTEIRSEKVKPPRVKESVASFECKVTQTISLGEEGGAGTLVICEVIMAHINKSVLGFEGRPDALKMDLIARLGGSWYSKIVESNLFKIAKPVSKIGIGVNQMPDEIIGSVVLSGNDLGKLGTIEMLPEENTIVNYLFVHDELRNMSLKEIHELAKEKLKEDEVLEAWLILLTKG